MDDDRIYNLLNYIACLSEKVEGVPETPERLKEINKAVHEVAHEFNKMKKHGGRK